MKRTNLEKAAAYVEREMTKMYPELKGCKAKIETCYTKKGYSYRRVTLENTAHKLDIDQRFTLMDLSEKALEIYKA